MVTGSFNLKMIFHATHMLRDDVATLHSGYTLFVLTTGTLLAGFLP
jgi:hypothetical protein